MADKKPTVRQAYINDAANKRDKSQQTEKQAKSKAARVWAGFSEAQRQAERDRLEAEEALTGLRPGPLKRAPVKRAAAKKAGPDNIAAKRPSASRDGGDGDVDEADGDRDTAPRKKRRKAAGAGADDGDEPGDDGFDGLKPSRLRRKVAGGDVDDREGDREEAPKSSRPATSTKGNAKAAPGSSGGADFRGAWDTFMDQLEDDEKLEWRPRRSRALLISERGEAQVGPPTSTAQRTVDSWLARLNKVDIVAFGPILERAGVTEPDDGKKLHCSEHQYNESALSHVWNAHIGSLRDRGETRENVLEAEWRRHRALAQLVSLEDRDRWILPDDVTDEPQRKPRSPTGLFDGMDPQNDESHKTLIKKFKANETKKIGFLREKASGISEGHWSMVGSLGGGTFGDAFLWGQYDSTGRLVNVSIKRLVCKDSYYPLEWWNWKEDARFWKVDEYTGELLPAEVIIMRRLRSRLSDSACMVRSLGDHVEPPLRMYRIYMELCPFGALHQTLNNHRCLIGRIDKDGNEVERRLPESALWALFDKLAQATYQMQNGHVFDEAVPAGSKWDIEILHLDMTPVNIFLGDPDQTSWQRYPSFKLGDFGQADETFVEMINDQEEKKAVHDYRLSAATNVWAIANLVIEALNLRGGDVKGVKITYKSKLKEPVIIDPDGIYSEELKQLLRECIRPNPEHRIPPEQLCKRIAQRVDNERGGAEPMRSHDSEADFIHYEKNLYWFWAQAAKG